MPTPPTGGTGRKKVWGWRTGIPALPADPITDEYMPPGVFLSPERVSALGERSEQLATHDGTRQGDSGVAFDDSR